MTTFTTLPDSSLAQDKPLTQSIARALRDNAIALAEGDATAPELRGVSPMLKAVASNSAALVFQNLPDTSDVFEFDLVRLRPATSGANQLYMQWSTDNGTTWVSNSDSYSYGTVLHYGGSVGSGAGQGSRLPLTDTSTAQQLTSDAAGACGRMVAYNFGTAGIKKFTDSRMQYQQTSGRFDVANTITNAPYVTDKVNAVRFFYGSGNIESGYITLRRVRAS